MPRGFGQGKGALTTGRGLRRPVSPEDTRNQVGLIAQKFEAAGGILPLAADATTAQIIDKINEIVRFVKSFRAATPPSVKKA